MRLRKDEALCLVIDVQERLMPAMDRAEETLGRIEVLIEGLKLLGVPFLVSEQYPKGLGPTLPRVADLLPGVQPFAKLAFSAADDPGLLGALEAAGRPTVVVCGVEAHVCVQQTVTDLAARGYRPVVCADAVTSRRPDDAARALVRMRDEGAVVTGVESLLFELLGAAGTDTFKAVSRLVR